MLFCLPVNVNGFAAYEAYFSKTSIVKLFRCQTYITVLIKKRILFDNEKPRN
jgi:hypothetical protein